MVSRPLNESFIIEEVKNYKWPEASFKDLGKRKDNDYKSIPRI